MRGGAGGRLAAAGGDSRIGGFEALHDEGQAREVADAFGGGRVDAGGAGKGGGAQHFDRRKRNVGALRGGSGFGVFVVDGPEIDEGPGFLDAKQGGFDGLAEAAHAPARGGMAAIAEPVGYGAVGVAGADAAAEFAAEFDGENEEGGSRSRAAGREDENGVIVAMGSGGAHRGH